MDYVRLDTEHEYIYFENDRKVTCYYRYYYGNFIRSREEWRSSECLKTCYKCIRMTRKRNIPIDKKTGVWYRKPGKKEE